MKPNEKPLWMADRFRGCLLGGAAGDALGYEVEFLFTDRIVKDYGPRGITQYALHNGTAVEFLHDASGSVPYQNQAGFASAEEIHRVFSVVLQSRFAAVMSTQDWVHSVKTGAVPVRDNIYKSNQRARGLLKDEVAQKAA